MTLDPELAAMLDKTLTLLQRPGDDDPSSRDLDRYGNRIDTPAPDGYVNCRGAIEFQPNSPRENEDEGGRNAGATVWTVFLEPDADVDRTMLIREYVDCDDYDSDVLHEFQLRGVDLVTTFEGDDSHWEVKAEELN